MVAVHGFQMGRVENVEHVKDKQENERERRESLANHQEKGDFFYLLDPMVRKPASVLTATMSDLVQDLELAKKMCKTSQLGPVLMLKGSSHN